MTMIETVVALALMGIISVTFLSGVGTAARATLITSEQTTAESLARSEIEYIKSYSPYISVGSSPYPIDPSIPLAGGWSIQPPLPQLVHATDDGIQKVTITVQHSGKTILSVTDYKVNR